MSEDKTIATKTAESIGETIRKLRETCRLSVRALASRSGFSPSLISQIELGQTTPSISSLERIALALGVTLAEFFHAAETKSSPVVHSESRLALNSSWSKATLEALGPIGAGRKLEPVMITIEAGGSSGKRPYAHSNERFALLIEGEVTLTLGEEKHLLKRGDAVTILPGVPFRWENHTSKRTQILLISSHFIP